MLQGDDGRTTLDIIADELPIEERFLGHGLTDAAMEAARQTAQDIIDALTVHGVALVPAAVLDALSGEDLWDGALALRRSGTPEDAATADRLTDAADALRALEAEQ